VKSEPDDADWPVTEYSTSTSPVFPPVRTSVTLALSAVSLTVNEVVVKRNVPLGLRELDPPLELLLESDERLELDLDAEEKSFSMSSRNLLSMTANCPRVTKSSGPKCRESYPFMMPSP